MNIADLLSYSLSSRHELQRRLGFLAQVHTTLFNYLHYRLLHLCITCVIFRTTHKNVVQIIKRPQRKQDPPISSGPGTPRDLGTFEGILSITKKSCYDKLFI